jgi:DNA helicase-2/ATP-dependent DNA helicase PcrA
MKDILQGLNKEQIEAVTTTEGPLLIIAGAGTGKTMVIARRIAYIIAKRLAKPAEILALTFTDKAAQEMEERVDILVPYGYVDCWISTFHSFGDRIIRENALELGLSPDFRILTRPEQVLFFQQNLFRFDLNYYRSLSNPTRFIQAIVTLISRAKDEDVTPEEYLAFAKKIRDREEREKQLELANSYQQYEEFKTQAGLLDFGDQIVKTLELFRKHPKILEEYQNKFKYILVDEYQDTNYAQNEIVKFLAQKHKNICVTGDDDQCLPPGSLISTSNGEKKIEFLKKGDEVLTAVGKGHLGASKITKVFKNKKRTRFLTFITQRGYKITVTDNHKMFCYVPVKKRDRNFHYVYLMYRQNLGWRIGVTDDLAVRLKLERSADKIVGLRSFPTNAETRYWEMFWALKYGIPPTIFKPRENAIVGDKLLKLYQRTDTEKAAYNLANDLRVDLDSPHYCLDAVTRGSSKRVKINLYLCDRKYVSKTNNKYQRILQNPSIMHSVSLQTTNESIIRKFKSEGVPIKKNSKGYVVRVSNADLQEAGKFAQKLQQITGGFLESKFNLGSLKYQHLPALVMPAGNVLPGHYLPIVDGFRVRYDKVVKVVERVKEEIVYDLEIARTHNFVANGVVVHNSIYKFRGAAISNILEFVKNFPRAKQVVLTQSYRSTQAILDSAYKLIKNNNPDRLEVRNKIVKKLKSQKRQYGPIPQVLYGATLSEETDLVAQEIDRLKKERGYQYKDFAILVRANNDAVPFIHALNLLAIPSKFSGSQGLYDREEIRLLISFLHSISNFSDSLNLYNLAISDTYLLDIRDCIKCMDYASRKNKSLHFVFENISKLAEELDVSKDSLTTIQKITDDIKKFAELSRKEKVGRVLYQYLEHTGYLKRLEREQTPEAEVKIANMAKFFEKISEFGRLAQEESARNFTEYLEFMRNAGEDPATAGIDPDIDAVNVMTIHQAKGLEFKVVFLVNLVAERFPTRERGDPIPLPEDLIKEILPVGDYHMQEERRLFYVGMTRGQDLVYLTFGRDYGGKRQRKVSLFVLEAFDKPDLKFEVYKSSPFERMKQIALAEIPQQQLLFESKVIRLNQQQIDDYLTCPLKYKYAAILRIPVLKHHAIIYGYSLHKAVEEFFRQKQVKKILPLENVLEIFEKAWESEGFLSAEHEEKRFEQGKLTLKNFWQRESKNKDVPTFIEKPFRFAINDVSVGGRWDRVDVKKDFVKIVDFKSSENIDEKKAKDRAKESVQLRVYALGYKKIYGRLPDSVGLYFLETGTIGEYQPDGRITAKAEEEIKIVEEGIRSGNFEAQPSHFACSLCPFNRICPFTATKI